MAENKLEIRPLGRSAAPSTPVPKIEPTPSIERPKPSSAVRQPSRQEIAAIIAAATATAAVATPPPPPPPPAPEKNGPSPKKSKPPKKPQSKEEKEANKEKRLQKLVGSVVVKCMSKYQKRLDHTQFKKHAKEVCGLYNIAVILFLMKAVFAVNTNNCRQGKEVLKLQGKQTRCPF
jgi:[histone H3]-lysine36 N-trimethyltransferase